MRQNDHDSDPLKPPLHPVTTDPGFPPREDSARSNTRAVKNATGPAIHEGANDSIETLLEGFDGPRPFIPKTAAQGSASSALLIHDEGDHRRASSPSPPRSEVSAAVNVSDESRNAKTHIITAVKLRRTRRQLAIGAIFVVAVFGAFAFVYGRREPVPVGPEATMPKPTAEIATDTATRRPPVQSPEPSNHPSSLAVQPAAKPVAIANSVGSKAVPTATSKSQTKPTNDLFKKDL